MEKRIENQGVERKEQVHYYIHYEGFDKRLDKWTISNEIILNNSENGGN
jgi:hypothetical protein